MPEKIRFDLFVKKNIFFFLNKEKNFSKKELEKIKALSRVFWQNQIKSGLIQTQKNKTTKPGFKIESGRENPVYFNWKKIRRDFYSNFLPQTLAFPSPLELLYDFSDFVAVNKPAGINTYNSYPILKKSPRTVSLVDMVCSRFPEIKKLGTERPGVVHRLDKETSGVLIIAKNNDSQSFIKRKFLKREFKKTYLALVPGKFPFENFFIKGLIGKSQNNPLVQKLGKYELNKEKIGNPKHYWEDYIKSYQDMGGQKSLGIINPKPSLTLGRVLFRGSLSQMAAGLKNREDVLEVLKIWEKIFVSTYKNHNKNHSFSLLEITPVSGRTHQIRVHLSEAGFPIVGDKIYGSQFPKIPSCHFLHAFQVSWENSSGKNLKIMARKVIFV